MKCNMGKGMDFWGEHIVATDEAKFKRAKKNP